MKFLEDEEINTLFKGDQNICWDAFVTDLSLFNVLSKSDSSKVSFVPFIHDEKIGSPDQNLAYCRDLEGKKYFISEDYSDSSGDATYTNIDTSYGIFYLPAIELERLKEYGINVKAISRKYIDYLSKIDKGFIDRLSQAGFLLNPDFYEIDKSFGFLPNKEDLKCLFDVHPEQKLFYLFTKSVGRFGIVPKHDQNYLFSSIKFSDSNIRKVLKSLFFDYLLKGLEEQAYHQRDKEEIRKRSNNLVNYLKSHIDSSTSIADFEVLVYEFMCEDLGIRNKVNLSRSSFIFASPKGFGLNNFFLNLLIRNTEAFIDSYNQALNETKLGLQRIKLINDFYNIPFYINILNANNEVERVQLFLEKNSKDLIYRSSENRGYKRISELDRKFVIGKAIPFLNELRLSPNAIALPEQGSKYLPAADSFVKNLRNLKINVPECRTIRIGTNFLDNLCINENLELKLPKVFHPIFGDIITCSELSSSWRGISQEIFKILDELLKFKEGQEVKEAKVIIERNKFMSFEFVKLLKGLVNELDKKTEDLRIKRNYATTEERLRVQILRFEIELAVNFYKQRLISIVDGLFYLNYRPYSIAIYLMFGANFINLLLRNVTFRTEIV